MNILTYAKSTLLHYRRTTLGVFAGAVITSMLLTGTLLVGDSAGKTLQNIALARLGKTDLLLNSRDRFFKTELSSNLEAELSTPIASILTIDGVALKPGTSPRQLNNVNIIGIDESFSSISSPHQLELGATEAAINETVARKLDVSVDDDISLRINRPGMLPRDAILSSRAESPYSRGTYTIKAVISDDGIGRFSPRANQLPPNNVFIRLDALQDKAGLEDQANIMLIPYRKGERIDIATAESLLSSAWQLDYFGLKLRTYKPNDVFQIESSRVFLNDSFDNIASNGIGSLTYMVNSISKTDDSSTNTTPYSFVNAIKPSDDRTLSPVPLGMTDKEVVINQWLAEELNVQAKDMLSIAYYRMDDVGNLSEHTREFTVIEIIEMKNLRSEEFLAPDFPGLSDVESCAGWDIGMPMDEEKLKDKANEEYWNTYRGTPKLFLTLDAGKSMWGNRYGNMTAIRFPCSVYDQQSISNLVREQVTPSQLGYFFEPARDQAQKSASSAMDLGQLFSGMSFFLIVAALMLTVLLFSFGVDQRSSEIGALIAMGFTRKRIKTLFLTEAAVLAVVSSATGSLCAFYYTKVLLWGLSDPWSDAVAKSSIEFYAHPLTPIIGAVSSFLIIIAVIALSIHRKSRAVSHQLLSGTTGRSTHFGNILCGIKHIEIICATPAAAAAFLMIYASIAVNNPANIFYGSGVLLLLSGIGFIFSSVDSHKLIRILDIT